MLMFDLRHSVASTDFDFEHAYYQQHILTHNRCEYGPEARIYEFNHGLKNGHYQSSSVDNSIKTTLDFHVMTRKVIPSRVRFENSRNGMTLLPKQFC